MHVIDTFVIYNITLLTILQFCVYSVYVYHPGENVKNNIGKHTPNIRGNP